MSLPAASGRRHEMGAAAIGAASICPVVFVQSGKRPAKTIHIAVASPFGGLADARTYAEKRTAKYGVLAVVDNKLGASAIFGFDAVASRWLTDTRE